MMKASTPKIVNKRLMIEAPSVTPLRRRSGFNNSILTESVHEKSDDNVERERRRSQAAIRKRLSNIPHVPNATANDSVHISQEEVNGHIQICMKLFVENKINPKNAWSLKIIDYLYKVKETLPVAGTSLDVSAKVFGVKVDDAHNYGMKLATMIVTAKNKEAAAAGGDENVEGGEDGDEDKENEEPRKKKQKKPKRLVAGQKSTICKDPKTLLGPIPKVHSTYFQTQSRSDLSAIDNLFTNRFPTDSSGYKFLFDGKQKAWTTHQDKDVIVDSGGDKKSPFELQPLANFKLCPAFDGFDLAHWNPEEEDHLFNESERSFKLNSEPLCIENGLPVAELDGSVHDIFADGAADADDAEENQNELAEEEFAAQFRENVEHIVSFRPTAASNMTEYSYNNMITAENGEIVDQIWAGPSHWKLKCIRASTARFSGRPVNPAQTEQQKQHRKKREKIAPITPDFFSEFVPVKKQMLNVKKKSSICDAEKITLPLPFNINLKLPYPLMTKPIILKKDKPQEEQVECEVNQYKYNNQSDSFYCSQNNDDDARCTDEEDGDLNNGGDIAQMGANFIGENLIEAPEAIPKNYIQYAKQAKRMDMKKLKAAVWMSITDGKADPAAPDAEVVVKEHRFRDVYNQLPQVISQKMRKDLSCPLAFAALLHLANEHNLELTGQSDLRDVFIRQAKGVK